MSGWYIVKNLFDSSNVWQWKNEIESTEIKPCRRGYNPVTRINKMGGPFEELLEISPNNFRPKFFPFFEILWDVTFFRFAFRDL